MQSPTVEIGELHLRAADMSAEQGEHLGQELARILTEQMPTLYHSAHVPNLQITLQVADLANVNDLAERVAAIISEKIRWASL